MMFEILSLSDGLGTEIIKSEGRRTLKVDDGDSFFGTH